MVNKVFEQGTSSQQTKESQINSLNENIPSFDLIKTTPRNLELLNKELYRFSISLSGMSRTISIKWGELNLDPESLNYLQKSGAKISAIPIFDALSEYARKLERKRRSIEEKTIFCQGERVVTATVYPQVFAEANEAIALAEEYRQELKEKYHQGLEDFKMRVRNIFQAPVFKLSPIEIENKVEIIEGNFISFDEINNFLQVRINTSRIPSLGEQIDQNTEQAKQFAALHTAKELEKAAKQGFEKMQKAQIEDLKELRTKVYDDTKTEISEILISCIETVDSFEIDKNNANAKSRIKRYKERMKILSEFDTDGNFLTALNNITKIDELFNRHTLKQLENLKSQLTETIEELKSNLIAVNRTVAIKPRRQELVF